ncbi:hypothetical protein CEUSTIGMA_g1242.t1 [Chlamydomonas eustigma]|uniref:Uncharacterized protein n=1 Tax=Chlamydomonas eustigma TaxID=1157962 RepID=A0A250WSM4_9CHLO|nr:hypothetical protein CEUSTIGMA_g1242.t1 [Chlamydomonas eustigma]|eukprot:GAX73791.1 hypothetical protein CEUSTIGMA_g1242.t1 [Chlamydomonas eustigma]
MLRALAAGRGKVEPDSDDEDKEEELDTSIQDPQDTLKLMRDARRARKAPPKFKPAQRWDSVASLGMEDSTFETHKLLVTAHEQQAVDERLMEMQAKKMGDEVRSRAAVKAMMKAMEKTESQFFFKRAPSMLRNAPAMMRSPTLQRNSSIAKAGGTDPATISKLYGSCNHNSSSPSRLASNLDGHLSHRTSCSGVSAAVRVSGSGVTQRISNNGGMAHDAPAPPPPKPTIKAENRGFGSSTARPIQRKTSVGSSTGLHGARANSPIKLNMYHEQKPVLKKKSMQKA